MSKKKTKARSGNSVEDNPPETSIYAIRQNSAYSSTGKAAPDNNIFFEERSNPLSSKGN